MKISTPPSSAPTPLPPHTLPAGPHRSSQAPRGAGSRKQIPAGAAGPPQAAGPRSSRQRITHSYSMSGPLTSATALVLSCCIIGFQYKFHRKSPVEDSVPPAAEPSALTEVIQVVAVVAILVSLLCLSGKKAMIWITLYFGVGVVVYGNLEGWSPLDASYFMVVVSTTVGYGDLNPVTDAGKVFTCLYALFGTTLIIGYLSPVVEAILHPIRSNLERMIQLSVDTRNLKISLAEVNRRISYVRRYLRASLGPILLIVFGILYARFVLHLTPVDSLYWSVITMTTVGLGDISPATSPASKLFAIVYLPLAATALADALGSVSAIGARSAIRDANELLQVEELLLQESQGDPNHKMTEADYLMRVLVQSDIVDEDTCIAVRRKFASILREDDDVSECTILDMKSKCLDSHTVYNLLKRQGKFMGDEECTYEDWFQSRWKTLVAKAVT